MKYLLTCFLAGCLVSPAWGSEPAVTLEEFLQKLEKAEPWTQKKVEALLGVKFTETIPDDRTVYKVNGQFIFAKGLIVKEIRFEVDGNTKKTNMLTLFLDNKSNCFTWGQIEKLIPGGFPEMVSAHGAEAYVKQMPWGEWGFGFPGPEEKNYDCLIDISITTNAFIEKYRD
jgi:hypothetical protein